ncbi:rhomboid family protein : Putative membrane protein OS=Singulisphaera acidiphila (strain ATCC BAA-1392 / DSM 18658 / VKM B-2454 / MOB10) GN=Sinac_5094 PE=4 SV=1: Rhomboid [Gemmata massiliana]|uniref:Peptidase S54 rhomboid domain-containing protein n=1 Tax=Gemmata massiliana TaxID=1210884 RepID=A0A6P2D5E0_9BACT|nr:rhomboid family intramembrane serine protease [Gemmata massiliana]VTR96498.1 rhomboid family protein : Putative membrane protein OS=Singulisphaera acidiphila (strain ATCC BAA-1392 / DSM 18658 / VKM B-2454 / MOB10) GN=Sinac_5094 PE=4 SV=1: Rhomboid [Gemmata massiliana]
MGDRGLRARHGLCGGSFPFRVPSGKVLEIKIGAARGVRLMGIQDRDYYREGPSFLDRVGQQGATVWLIAITVGVFFGQIMTGWPRALSPLVAYGAFDTDAVLRGEVWRLLTAAFLHADLWHLFFNMLILYWAGTSLETVRGSRELVLFYLFSAVGANVFYLGGQLAGLTPMGRAIGASGAVTATLVLFAFHFPRAQVRLYFFIPMPVWLMVVVFVGFDALFALGAADPRGGRIAYLAHLGGAAFGLIYFQSGVRFSNLFAASPKTRARPKLRVIAPPVEDAPAPVAAVVEAPPRRPADEQLEAKLDAVLAKVSKYGPESLSPDEREIFYRAGELYKKRRK